jgi:hypothetical protein
LLVLLFGCAHTPPEQKLEQGCTRHEGTLVRVEPEAQFDRLFIFVTNSDEGMVATAAYNDNNFAVLDALAKRLEPVIGKPVTVWGQLVGDAGWQEFPVGIYMKVEAIGWTDEETGVWFIVSTEHGDNIRHNISVGDVFKGVIKVGKELK